MSESLQILYEQSCQRIAQLEQELEQLRAQIAEHTELESTHREICLRLGDFCRANNLGLGGEPYDRLAIEYATELKSRLASIEADTINRCIAAALNEFMPPGPHAQQQEETNEYN